MKIEKCILEYIGCFQDRVIDFSNLTIIYGENRTGKSTLVYALFFALFGKHLNSHLRVKDLCQKGKKSGRAELLFKENNNQYSLHQFTDRMPKMFEKSGIEDEWNPVSLNDPEKIKSFVPIDAETASLTSFFRESELIYFLQDIPKYNNTLIQNLIGMDQALIARSRFRKALGKAKEYKKAIVNAGPKKKIDILSVELSRRKIIEAEKELESVDVKYRTLTANQSQDPTIYKLLQKQYADKKKQHESLVKMRKNFLPEASLEKEKKDLEEKLSSNEQGVKTAHELGEDIRVYMQKGEQLGIRKKELMRLENNRECPLCSQIVPKEQLSELLSDLELKSKQTREKQEQIKNELSKLNIREKQKAFIRQSLEKIRMQIKESMFLDSQVKEVSEQLSKLELDLKQFESLNLELKETESMISQKQFLENRRDFLQKEIIHNKVLIKQYEDVLKRKEENRKNLKTAEKQVLLCDIAFQAIDEAIQGMGHKLLDKIRGSIQNWSGCFSFLNQFDIKIGDRELLPIIQAKGYQYKLNQMSKSERIFLYLLLKLSIGDALGHLDLFILDDPADGLDLKRKQTLAYLLAEVAKKRQVIITTNDTGFADLFSSGSRINL